MMAPTKMKLRVRKKEKGSAKSSQQQQQPLRPETSPDSKCPICLDRFVNVASVERCLHRFCFRCIREWAKNKAECPLCKQPFRSIFHSVRAENDFKEFVVMEENAQSATTSASAAVTLTAAALSVAPASQNDPEATATRTRSRATRTRQRRSQIPQDPAPSASSVEGVPLDHAALIQRDPACLRQLLPLLRRERVIGANPSELRPFLLARTDHILHELVSFARSIEAMQCPQPPSYEEDSGSQSSIINISEDDDDSVEADVTKDSTQDHVPQFPMANSSEMSLSQSAWDDETPGPSYSTLGHPEAEDVEPDVNQSEGTSAATEQREHNEDDDNGEEEECMIVGYVKPMAERTPELVQLSSDSTEEEEGGNEAASTETIMKAEISLPSHEQAPLSPKPYPSTSHTKRGENLEQSAEQDARMISHHRRKEHAPRHSFRKSSHSVSGSRSQSSSESSPQSKHSVKISRANIRLTCREQRRQSHHMLGQSPSAFAEREGSSSEEHVQARSGYVREKSFKSFSPWDSPSHEGERRKKRRKKRREKETERSRSPHRKSQHCHGDRELWLPSSSSSDVDLCREKPAGKRKYKTRHLERTARRRSSGKSRERERERERSPSVEIIFERRAADTHSRGRRHKKRCRRKEREQNSPTIITIDSDSSSDHTSQTCHTEANSHTADLQNRIIDEDKDQIGNDLTADCQVRIADDNEHITDFSDHTIDYQERIAELSDRTTDDKDCVTDWRNFNRDSKDHFSEQTTDYQNCGTVLSDHMAEYEDGVAGDGIQTSNHKDKVSEVADYTTDCRHGVRKAPDQDRSTDVSGRRAEYKHRVTEVNSKSTDCKGSVKDVRGYTADSNHDHTTDLQESLLDVDNVSDQFQDSVADMRNRGEPSASVLDMLNLEHCFVDMVQPTGDTGRMAATSLSGAPLLDVQDSMLGEGQRVLRNCTVDQQEVGLEAHRDQSEGGAKTAH
ncbi:E3 ubiquitin-protein ligase Topors [Tachysurus fulvidraco]|uniref:E3 ubiquitin-protein ligase Topors n=1 Tax=Tachysurus fulvidraco TaxID=1234273 RepID=UPI001FF01A6C|nr:E3 ubiquitin-protein ligase Topors [Tachysurus fulvidraco]XP_047662802.1 E3 ubiquitin-protein ligase Topors [Tachysurus fulvidraco]